MKSTAIAIKPDTHKVLITLSIYFGVLVALFFISDISSATDKSLGSVAGNVKKSMSNVAQLLVAISYVAGVGFALMGMLKLKAHKDNATQVPLSQPIVLLLISAGLIFLPNLITTGGATVWGDGSAGRADAGGGGLDDDAAATPVN